LSYEGELWQAGKASVLSIGLQRAHKTKLPRLSVIFKDFADRFSVKINRDNSSD